ncbi:DinB family protein [Ferruginibacter sp. HRS2-29]|uniref:DinB family protein n=1 Tax=Ferruginibacter sp. HRS2-29 TaxID=2487334 RepID=UPI0020CE18AF|nr:DinB family protein [Ferruginibacter sp. HRS2-29]
MTKSTYRGAVKALLAENEKAIRELQQVLVTVSDQQLAAIVDHDTPNPDCRSIQTIMTHVVAAGFSYCVYIRNHRGGDDQRPQRRTFATAAEYIAALEDVNVYTHETFNNIYDHELEFFNESEKILTRWKQHYDYEQLMEHAIVHILRHRRQIEGFL